MRMSRVLEGHDALQALDRAEPLWRAQDVPLTARAPWLRTYAAAYRRDRPVVVEISEAGRTVAVGCLARVDGAVVEWTSLGIDVSDFAALAAEDDDSAQRLARAIAQLVRSGRRPWRLRLEQLPAGDRVLAALQPLLPHVLRRPGIPALRLALTEPRTLERHVSRNARRTVRKGWNRLERDGHEVVVRQLRRPAEVAAVLDAVVALRKARDLQLRGGSDFDDHAFECFYRTALRTLAGLGQVELTVLEVGDELIGYTLGFLDGPTYRLWDGRVAREWTTYSAGRIGDALALTSALADARFSTVDWMRGEQEYKHQAMTHRVEHEHLHAWSSAALRQGYRVVGAVRRRARRARRAVEVRLQGDG